MLVSSLVKVKPCRRVLTALLLLRTLRYQTSPLHNSFSNAITSFFPIRSHSIVPFLAPATRPKAMQPHSDELPDRYKFIKRKAPRFPAVLGKRFKMGPAVVSEADEEFIQERSQLIVRFYDPKIKARDTRGRTLEDILSWSDSKLESCHNYIQMLFPLPEGSIFNLDAPVIDIAVMQAFRSRDELRQQLHRSFERILNFYGFQVANKSDTRLEGGKKAILEKAQTDTSTNTSNGADDSTAKKIPSTEPASSASDVPPYNIIRGPNWDKQCQNWAVPFDHNHLRISRILRCLRVLGLEREATAFLAALERTYEDPQLAIGAKSMSFWQSAATRPLHIAPDDEKCDWLETWEKEQENSGKPTNLDGDVQENQKDGSSV